jgi:hypothetical protein
VVRAETAHGPVTSEVAVPSEPSARAGGGPGPLVAVVVAVVVVAALLAVGIVTLLRARARRNAARGAHPRAAPPLATPADLERPGPGRDPGRPRAVTGRAGARTLLDDPPVRRRLRAFGESSGLPAPEEKH